MSQPSISELHVEGSGGRRLRNLRYTRIDLVDKGASQDSVTGQGAHVLLYKRADIDKAEWDTAYIKAKAQRTLDAAAKEAGVGEPTEKEGMKKVLSDLDVEIEKAGRKVSSARMSRMKEMRDMMSAWINDAEHDGKKPAPTGAGAEPDEEEEDDMAEVEKKLEEVEKAHKAEIEALKKRLEESDAKAKAAEEVAKKERDERLQREYIAKTAEFKGLPVKPDDDWKILKAIDERLEPEDAKRVRQLLKAADEAIVKGNLFAEMGTGGQLQGGAWDKIQALAQEKVAKGGGMTIAKAIELVAREHPELYKQYQDERANGR